MLLQFFVFNVLFENEPISDSRDGGTKSCKKKFSQATA